jgi:hypothetical protein
MTFWVSRPTRPLVRLTGVLTIFCLTVSLASAAESQPRWMTNEGAWFGEIAPCFGFSAAETARRWRRLQAATESSTLSGPDLRRLFAALAFLTQHAQSTPADAATALQIFETGFSGGYLRSGDVHSLNLALPGTRAIIAQGLLITPEIPDSGLDIVRIPTSLAAVVLSFNVETLATAQGQGNAPCGFSALPPAPPHKEASREQKKGRSDAAKRKMQAATGTVYYHSNGNHGGKILLKTDAGLLDLLWDDESQLNFSDSPGFRGKPLTY